MKDHITVVMQDVFGISCGSGTAAVGYLKEFLLPQLQAGRSVRFDFTGVRVINSSFGNALFGNLCKMMGDVVLERVVFEHVRPIVKSEISSSIAMGLRGFKPRGEVDKSVTAPPNVTHSMG